ncbi:PREDICTED: BAHD acyltransferase At5g47980-like [Prunus mume]|uniref:BAHD acyltransferase At5g47980-like n=1 Tax=Prunus mume TaxID=102107 RepID=A0ABM0PL63_PRUMU|nr:PREDICTED: BAHD acyltransferase At5g47980-like [Prunus mume]
MGSEVKVEVIRKETIKPSSPTPHHLRTSSLSVFDQLQPDMYISLLLFYPNNISDDVVNNIDHNSLFAERSKLLKTSLSEALTQFYPFAGEFEYNVSISCNDHGAGFIESKVNCPIRKVLDKPDFGILEQLIPVAIKSKSVEAGHLLLVQVNLFECGGLTIGVSISHKVADASTLSTFIKTWATIALGSASTASDQVLLPVEFGVAATLFPPQDVFNSPQPIMELIRDSCIMIRDNCITKRLVFDASKIAALKSKAASAAVPNPTRVEVVSALIWKCALQASRSNLGFTKPSAWVQVVNLRKRSGLAMAENILGNFVSYFTAMTMESDAVELESLVHKLRKGIDEYKEKYANGVSGEDAFQIIEGLKNLMMKDSIETYGCTSWCRFSFNQADFGWGKPSWMNFCRNESKNTMILTDMSDGVGIEAFFSLEEEHMAIFERNEYLLAYASMNPSVV